MTKQLVYSKDITIDNLFVGLKYISLTISGRIYKTSRSFLGWTLKPQYSYTLSVPYIDSPYFDGERQLQSLSKWIHENKADWNEKCLLVFDEVDKGFDLRYQVGLHNMLTNLPVMHGVKILAVSHTLIPMLLEDKVYAFKYRIMLSPSTYVALETGYSIKINDYNEREEV